MYIKIKVFFLALLSLSAYSVEFIDITNLINKRLYYMQDVAYFKYQNDILVEDLEREKFILEKVKQQAHLYQLDACKISNLFKSQIQAAKEIQYNYIDQWKLNAVNVPLVLDLKNTIRPELDKLTTEIMINIDIYLAENKTFSQDQYEEFLIGITEKNISELSKKMIFLSLLDIKK